jgi:hypothetical protein
MLRDLQAPRAVTEQWLRRALPAVVREKARALGVQINDGTEDAGGVDGSALIGALGSLWWLETPDLTVVRCLDAYAAVGTGDEVALGALHATRAWESGRKRCLAALGAAAAHIAGVRAPFVVIKAVGGSNQ